MAMFGFMAMCVVVLATTVALGIMVELKTEGKK